MNLAIIGYGIVGKATHQTVLANDRAVDIYDINHRYPEQNPCHDVIFICVPTANAQDVEDLGRMCHAILQNSSHTHICIRSTVPVGFASQGFGNEVARIWYFPEFLRERYWSEDSLRATWLVGCADPSQPVLAEIFKAKPPIYLTLVETEILKLMSNAYAAMHVVFANHFYDISKKMHADYDVIETWHGQVRHSDQNYLKVSTDLRGFGGKCLPKDLEFLISSFAEHQIKQTLFDSIRDDNEKWPTTVRTDR